MAFVHVIDQTSRVRVASSATTRATKPSAEKPQIALGDALGSNVVNVAVILGAALAISGIRARARRGFLLLVLYAAYLTTILQMGAN